MEAGLPLNHREGYQGTASRSLKTVAVSGPSCPNRATIAARSVSFASIQARARSMPSPDLSKREPSQRRKRG